MNVTIAGIGIGSLAAVLVAGLPSASTGATPGPSPGAGEPQELGNLFEVGEPFPEVALPTLDDGSLTTMAAFRGEKVILHVFASW